MDMGQINCYNPEALNIGQSLQPSHPTKPFFGKSLADLVGEPRYKLVPENSRPRPFFQDIPGAPASVLLRASLP